MPTLLEYIHGGLRATRGAAVSIARFDPSTPKMVFAGIGNVAGMLAVDGEMRRMVSMPGTAGYNARKIQSFEYPFRARPGHPHSDGLATELDAEQISQSCGRHPTLIAAILYRDFTRHRDDATVLVASGGVER